MNILDELTQGTSCWNETCEPIPDTDDWLICFDYAWAPDYTTEYTWCTLASDPEPPPPPDPGPPPPGWPEGYGDEVSMYMEAFFGAPCWQVIPNHEVPFDPSVGPWGGYQSIFEAVGPGDLLLKVYPVAWVPGAVTWRFEWEVFLGGSGFRDSSQAAGFLPAVLLDMGEIADCPFTRYAISVYIPP